LLSSLNICSSSLWTIELGLAEDAQLNSCIGDSRRMAIGLAGKDGDHSRKTGGALGKPTRANGRTGLDKTCAVAARIANAPRDVLSCELRRHGSLGVAAGGDELNLVICKTLSICGIWADANGDQFPSVTSASGDQEDEYRR